MANLNAVVKDPNANSYVDLPKANTMVANMLFTDDVSEWTEGTDDQRERALIGAAQRLDTERFLGIRTTSNQSMQWPREGVRRPDYVTNSFLDGAVSDNVNPRYFDPNVVPPQIEKAQVELAVYLHANPEGISLSGLEDYKQISIGSLRLTSERTGEVNGYRVPPMYQRYLQGLRLGGPGNVSIQRA